MKALNILFLVFLFDQARAQLNVFPPPAYSKLMKGSFEFREPVGLIYLDADGDGDSGVPQFKELLENKYGIKKIIEGDTHSYGLPSQIFIDISRQYPNESYQLNITGSEIYIKGNANGVFYAFQTLMQMMKVGKDKKIRIPCALIKDHPRFSYRGMHLDVARHYFPVSQVKKYIDYLALHKFNNFHWHLTDDQGWRIEIKKYPLLTNVGGCRAQTLSGRYGSDVYDSMRYCGFYTQKQIKDVVKYAADRYINIIPEIEMPGHSLAALASYPYLGCTKGPYKVMETWGVSNDVLCAGNDSTYTFLQNVLDEVMTLFPSKYIHIGGDECPKDRWKKCPVCQQRIKKENLKDEHALQSYFVQRIEKYVNSKGRKIIGWDEILEGGLAPNATVMSWRGITGGIAAAKQGHDVIMSPEHPLYFNHSQTKNEDSVTQGGYNPLEDVYNYDPVPAELDPKEAKHISGAQGNVWTEYIDNFRKLEYSVFPRMAALAEVVWSPKTMHSWQGFQKRLPSLFAMYRNLGINFSNAYYDIQPSVIQLKNGVAWKLESRNTTGKIIYVKGKDTNASFGYDEPLAVNNTSTYGAALTAPDHSVISSWVWQDFNVNKATGKKIVLASVPGPAYAGNGGFTLIDGIQNTQGMLHSSQFLGFSGKDLEAVIDLDTSTVIRKIVLHAFEQTGSWIYAPASVIFYTSVDGVIYTALTPDKVLSSSKNILYSADTHNRARYIKVIARNFGKIPYGYPGSGSDAWLFADEIEVY